MLTVIVTTFNRWGSCATCLRSLLEQECANLRQIILVDDCSTHEPPSEIRGLLKNPKIVFRRHATNRGLAAARNTAIRQVKTEFFSFCDDDDWWPPEMAKKLLLAAQEKGMAIGVPEDQSRWWLNRSDLRDMTLARLFQLGTTPPVGSQIFNTQLVLDADLYDEAISSGVDHDLWVRLLPLNPSVGISVGATAHTGKAPGQNRMTTSVSQREKGIRAALQIWKPTLDQELGTSFFEYFERSYDHHIRFVFMLSALRSANYREALGQIVSKPKLLIMAAIRILVELGLRDPTGSNFGVFYENRD